MDRVKSALIIFSKAPVPGLVKTRLQPLISAKKCAYIQKIFISETVRIATSLTGVDLFLGCHPDMEDPYFSEISGKYPLTLFRQSGRDLGERMETAISDHLRQGYEKIVIIGSDSPHLPSEYISEAFQRLDSSDMVIGPSEDGGYYLIGARRVIPVFDGVDWGTDSVFGQTIQRAKEAGLAYSVLKVWYDIDTIEDLLRLRKISRGWEEVLEPMMDDLERP